MSVFHCKAGECSQAESCLMRGVCKEDLSVQAKAPPRPASDDFLNPGWKTPIDQTSLAEYERGVRKLMNSRLP